MNATENVLPKKTNYAEDATMTDHNDPITLWKSIILYAVVSLFLFFEMAVQVSPGVMSTQLMRDLNVSAFGLGIMSGFYFYSYTIMQIPSGILLDKYSPRIIITLSLLTCAFGTLLFATADSIYIGSIARLLMGLGSAFAFVSVLVVTADLFEAKYFATITGITQMLAAFGAMTGQLPIAALQDKIGWRSTMLVLAAIGLALALLVFNVLKYKKCKFIVSHLHSGSTRTKNNLLQIFTKPQTWFIALYACLLWAPMSGFASLWGVPFLTSADQLTPASSAFICSFMWLGLALCSPLIGILYEVVENKKLLFSITALIGAASFYFILAYSLSEVTLAILLFLAGGSCAGQALSFTLIKENNPAAIKGTAIAFNNMAVVISGAIFQPFIGKLIDYNHVGAVINYTSVDFKRGLAIIFVCYFLAFLIATTCFRIKRDS
jgi:MFS family permease